MRVLSLALAAAMLCGAAAPALAGTMMKASPKPAHAMKSDHQMTSSSMKKPSMKKSSMKKTSMKKSSSMKSDHMMKSNHMMKPSPKPTHHP